MWNFTVKQFNILIFQEFEFKFFLIIELNYAIMSFVIV